MEPIYYNCGDILIIKYANLTRSISKSINVDKHINGRPFLVLNNVLASDEYIYALMGTAHPNIDYLDYFYTLDKSGSFYDLGEVYKIPNDYYYKIRNIKESKYHDIVNAVIFKHQSGRKYESKYNEFYKMYIKETVKYNIEKTNTSIKQLINQLKQLNAEIIRFIRSIEINEISILELKKKNESFYKKVKHIIRLITPQNNYFNETDSDYRIEYLCDINLLSKDEFKELQNYKRYQVNAENYKEILHYCNLCLNIFEKIFVLK